jgi:hypothetical protein
VLWVEDAASDWLAFARREELDCGPAEPGPEPEPETELVRIAFIDSSDQRNLYDRWERHLKRPADDPPPLGEEVFDVRYPVRAWALPEEEAYAEAVRIFALRMGEARPILRVAVVREDLRRQLGVVRATVLTILSNEVDTQVGEPVTVVGPEEAIVLLVGTQLG